MSHFWILFICQLDVNGAGSPTRFYEEPFSTLKIGILLSPENVDRGK